MHTLLIPANVIAYVLYLCTTSDCTPALGSMMTPQGLVHHMETRASVTECGDLAEEYASQELKPQPPNKGWDVAVYVTPDANGRYLVNADRWYECHGMSAGDIDRLRKSLPVVQ
jgi:hypothetical protein